MVILDKNNTEILNCEVIQANPVIWKWTWEQFSLVCLQREKSTESVPWSGLWLLCTCLWFALWLHDHIWGPLRDVAGTYEKQVSQVLVAIRYPSACLSLGSRQALCSPLLSRGSQMEMAVSACVSWAKSRALHLPAGSSPLSLCRSAQPGQHRRDKPWGIRGGLTQRGLE